MDWLNRVLLALCVALFLMIVVVLAYPQEIHHHDGLTEAMDRFYSTWRTPQDGRQGLCCDKRDCYVPEAIKHEDGKLYFLRREDRQWVRVPANRIEQNYDDAKEAPDGQNHVCAVVGTVYCFTYGAGV